MMMLLVLDLSERLVGVIHHSGGRRRALGYRRQSRCRWNRCRSRALLSGWLSLGLRLRLRLTFRLLDERPFRDRVHRRIGKYSWNKFLIKWTFRAAHHLFVILHDRWD